MEKFTDNDLEIIKKLLEEKIINVCKNATLKEVQDNSLLNRILELINTLTKIK